MVPVTSMHFLMNTLLSPFQNRAVVKPNFMTNVMMLNLSVFIVPSAVRSPTPSPYMFL